VLGEQPCWTVGFFFQELPGFFWILLNYEISLYEKTQASKYPGVPKILDFLRTKKKPYSLVLVDKTQN
jgi:hypothetical protein